MSGPMAEKRTRRAGGEPGPPAMARGALWARTGMALGAVGVVIAIGWVDYLTGPELGFSLFYLVPVVAAGWWLGRGAAVATSLFASGSWYVAEIAWYGFVQRGVSLWNGGTRLVIFLAMGVLVAKVRGLLDHEQVLSRTDVLTGLPNSRWFFEVLREEIVASQRLGLPLCLVYVDLDNFKGVNDHYGHGAGDDVLRQAAETMRGSVRTTDRMARLGGDEFALLLLGAGHEDARGIAQRIVDGMFRLGARYSGSGLGATAGVACFTAPPADVEEVLRRADAAMYRAKAEGKGRVEIWSQGETT